jgi:hypothetical protein
MRTVTIIYTLMLVVMINSCEAKCSAGGSADPKPKGASSGDNNALNGAIIKNDIEIEATGVKLKEAYLVDADKNPLKENTTRVGEKIYAVITLDTGWVKVNGRSFIGASERIVTPEGRVVVNADDIFKVYDAEGIDKDDAAFITLSAVISSAGEGTDKFVVHFRLWDKKGSGEIKGKYKFSLVK